MTILVSERFFGLAIQLLSHSSHSRTLLRISLIFIIGLFSRGGFGRSIHLFCVFIISGVYPSYTRMEIVIEGMKTMNCYLIEIFTLVQATQRH